MNNKVKGEIDVLLTKTNELAEYCGQRKHISQLKGFEHQGLWKRIKAIKEWNILPHTFDRLREKGIRATKKDITSTVFYANIIEYRIIWNKVHRCYDERLILRSKAFVNGRYNLNVVYSLTTKNIVTVWLNHENDKHNTLDWNIYNKDMKVFGV